MESPSDGICRRTFKRLRGFVISRFPKRLELPARYQYRRIFGHLEKEFSILGRLAGGGVALDIGGNIGLYTYRLSQLCSRVEYFEPNPASVRMIKNLRLKNVTVHNVGVSSADGTMRLYVPVVNGVRMTELANFQGADGEHDELEVPVRRLDGLGFTGVSFIKIDVEGHELEVLDGAEETILRERPVMMVEIAQHHLSVPMRAVFDRVLGMGYTGYFFMDGRLHPLTGYTQETGRAPGTGRVFFNFIFIPANRQVSL